MVPEQVVASHRHLGLMSMHIEVSIRMKNREPPNNAFIRHPSSNSADIVVWVHTLAVNLSKI